MKFKSVLLLAVAIACGLVAMLGVRQVLSKEKGATDGKMGQVLVATTDIAPGEPLDENNTTFKKMPTASVPQGAVTTAEEFAERALLYRAVEGEVLMLAKLGERGVYGAAAEIPKGMQVVTVSVNLTMTHSGMIRPGDRVDIMVTYPFRHPDRGMIKKTKKILEFVKVFATDNVRDTVSTDTQELKAKNISLVVEPDQAMLLKHAESKGSLHLTLRSRTDDGQTEVTDISDIDFDDLLSGAGEKDKEEENPVLYEDAVANGANSDDARPGDVREFLRNQGNEANAEVAVDEPVEEEVPEPETPKWQIRIFAGSEPRIEEVDDPAALEEINENNGLPSENEPAASGSATGTS